MGENLIGTTISHYRILSQLGKGGMGVVYKAEDTRLKRTVALKFIASEFVGKESEKIRLLREAQAAAALEHENICTVYEIDEVEGRIFIVMALAEGENLHEMISSGKLETELALDLAAQMAEGLQEAHDKGIVHRDIKPANVIVTSRPQAKIMDFGLAKIANEAQITEVGIAMGTAPYMSPEQAKGEPVDHRTDIWSLGITLYEMLSGRLPFVADQVPTLLYSICHNEPNPIDSERRALPVGIEAIINKCLAKNPNNRYQSAGALKEDIERLKRGSGGLAAFDTNTHHDRDRAGQTRLASGGTACCDSRSASRLPFHESEDSRLPFRIIGNPRSEVPGCAAADECRRRSGEQSPVRRPARIPDRQAQPDRSVQGQILGRAGCRCPPQRGPKFTRGQAGVRSDACDHRQRATHH